MKKYVTLILALVLCLSVIPYSTVGVDAADSKAVYMIFANPAEDCNTQMNIGWHSDADCTECYVEVTTADDKNFEKAYRYDGTYDAEAYKWFYNRLTTNELSNSRYTNQFLDWGVTLTNLIPDTDYIYRIADGKGLYSAARKFKTGGADNFSIIWTSDPHVNSAYPGRLTDYNNIIKFAEIQAKYDVAFQLSTGDNLACGDRYNDWLSVSNMKASKNYMFATTIGNHDVYDGAMTKDPLYTNYWNSAEYFRIALNNPQNGYTQDSQRITGYYTNPDVKHYIEGLNQYADRSASELIEYTDSYGNKCYCTGAKEDLNGRAYWFNYNGILFIMFDYYAMMFDGDTSNALAWASSVVEANAGKYDYIICSTHINQINAVATEYAPAGDFRVYGSTDYKHFQPFLDKYDVDVFIAGDHHVYLRTGAIYNGAETSEEGKGTHIIQAPCISRPQGFDASGSVGYVKEMYSLGGKTVGDLVIDVDENGLTFRALVYEAARPNVQYYEYDSYTVPKKNREKLHRVDFIVGDLQVETQYVKDGEAAIAPVVSSEAYDIGEWDKAFDNVTEDMIITAPATVKTYEVKFVGMDGSTIKTETVGHGSAATAPEVPVVAGFEFIGWDVEFDNITAATTVTALYEKAYIYGDANGDDKISPLDASMALQYNAKLVDADKVNVDALDVNDDGRVTPLDASLILQYDAKLIKEFPIEKE